MIFIRMYSAFLSKKLINKWFYSIYSVKQLFNLVRYFANEVHYRDENLFGLFSNRILEDLRVLGY
jgi:hypothetical protein